MPIEDEFRPWLEYVGPKDLPCVRLRTARTTETMILLYRDKPEVRSWSTEFDSNAVSRAFGLHECVEYITSTNTPDLDDEDVLFRRLIRYFA